MRVTPVLLGGFRAREAIFLKSLPSCPFLGWTTGDGRGETRAGL